MRPRSKDLRDHVAQVLSFFFILTLAAGALIGVAAAHFAGLGQCP
jgi:hypothetical protein